MSPAPLHWLQLQISTLHQPQPSEGAIASSHFLGFLSVTPPSAYLLHQALDQELLSILLSWSFNIIEINVNDQLLFYNF